MKEEPEINIWLDSITNIQLKQAKLENLFSYMVENLSVRSKNALNLGLGFHNNITGFLKYLFSLQSILILPNVGKTSEFEIQTFLTNIHQAVKKLYKSEKIAVNTELDLMECMGFSQYLIDEYVKHYPNNDISFFSIIDLVIKDSLSSKELKILKYRRDYWNVKQVTLECLGKKMGVTRERVRQIEKNADEKLWLIIKGLPTGVALINFKQRYEFYDEFITNIAIINKLDKTNFSDNFLYRVLFIFLKEDYELIFSSKDRCKFLIKKSIDNAFDFRGFIDTMKNLVEKSNTDYSLDFKGFIYSFFKSTSNDTNTNKIILICEDLLNFEFGIVLDIDNQILIKSKNKKSVDVYAEEALNQANKPMHLDTIYSAIKKNYPQFNKTKISISNAFVGNDKFIFFDRNSTYGLKSWEGKLTQDSVLIDTVKPDKTDNNRSGIKVWLEGERIVVKGGTIISIVIEYLKESKEPRHINDIFSEVEKWRDTNKFKLVSNMKANNKDYFIFHKNNLIELVDE